MRKGWEIKKLEEVCNILDKLRKPITQKDRIEGEYPYYGATGILSYVHNYIFSEKLVLIGEDGAKWLSGDRTSFIADGKYWVNNHAHVIRPIRDVTLDEWIVYFLNFSDLTEYVTGMTVPKLNQEKMRSIKIPIPPLTEQQRIVSILDETFSSIEQAKENLQRNLQNAKELFQSELNSIFTNKGKGWEEKKLSDLFSIKHGFAFKGEFFSDKGDYVLLTPGNFYEKGGYRDRGDKQKYYIGDIPNDYILQNNDLLIAMTEQAAGLLGSPLIVPESDTFLHNQRLGLFIYNDGVKMNPKFLFHLFNTFRIRFLIHKSASGVKVRHTSPSKVLEINVNIPNLEIQQKIVQQLDKLSAETKRLEAMYQQKLDALEELKKSILQKAFSGELSEN